VTTIRPLRLVSPSFDMSAMPRPSAMNPVAISTGSPGTFLPEQFEQSGHERAQRAAMLAIQIIVALRERRAAQRLQLQFGREHRKPGIGINGGGPLLDSRHGLGDVAPGVAQCGLDLCALFGLMPLYELQQDRLLVRKIRIERSLRKPAASAMSRTEASAKPFFTISLRAASIRRFLVRA